MSVVTISASPVYVVRPQPLVLTATIVAPAISLGVPAKFQTGRYIASISKTGTYVASVSKTGVVS